MDSVGIKTMGGPFSPVVNRGKNRFEIMMMVTMISAIPMMTILMILMMMMMTIQFRVL